ncbi:MAG: response regulator, partial [Leptospiraceae bacterium]|nr:response regulator [Leptospiraceae bacterium]
SNALKFTRAGEVKIELDAKIGEHDDADTIELIGRVSDTGPGIPEKQQNRIFESFMQLDESVASNFGGSGLGLNVVRELLELMGGSIRLISPTPDGTPENPGTCMEFHIPFRKGSEQHNGNQPNFSDQFPRIQARVLIGEDNPVNQLILTKYLEKADCQVTAFSNGKDVLAHALENHASFDLICLDLRMPDMDGHEVVRELRTRDIHIPVIAITADAYSESMNRSEQVGMNAHLVKPLEASQLYSRMLHLLKKSQAG